MNEVAPNVIGETLRSVIRGLIKRPDKMDVRVRPAGRMVIVEIKVDDTDFGKVLGAKRVNLNALQAITRTIGAKHHVNVEVTLINPTSRQPNHDPFFENPNWKKDEIEAIAIDLAAAVYEGADVEATDTGSTTVIDVSVGELEPEIDESVKRILEAIGKTMGRSVFVNIEREDIPA